MQISIHTVLGGYGTECVYSTYDTQTKGTLNMKPKINFLLYFTFMLGVLNKLFKSSVADQFVPGSRFESTSGFSARSGSANTVSKLFILAYL
jgi:hypothetical protein